jgi:hypothetical protein
MEVRVKTGNIARVVEDTSKVGDIFLKRRQKNCGVIRIERGSEMGALPGKRVETSSSGGNLNDPLERVDSNIKEERREGVSLSKAPSMFDGHTQNSI